MSEIDDAVLKVSDARNSVNIALKGERLSFCTIEMLGGANRRRITTASANSSVARSSLGNYDDVPSHERRTCVCVVMSSAGPRRYSTDCTSTPYSILHSSHDIVFRVVVGERTHALRSILSSNRYRCSRSILGLPQAPDDRTLSLDLEVSFLTVLPLYRAESDGSLLAVVRMRR